MTRTPPAPPSTSPGRREHPKFDGGPWQEWPKGDERNEP